MEAHFKRRGIYDQLPVLIDPRLGRAAIVQAPAPFVYANAEAEQVARADQLLDLRGLCFGTDSLVGDGSYRVTDSTEDLLFSVEDPVGFLSSMVDRLDGPYSASEWSEDEQFDSSVEQVRSSDPPFSRSALRLCPIGHRKPLLCREALPGLCQHGPRSSNAGSFLGPAARVRTILAALSPGHRCHHRHHHRA
jgi:hypothetical protein